ncbi:MAG: glycosyltransferase family 4 protein [Armatimonadota bacterium]|nr:glycosyltransferase family 4 protein [Armatimonadota bacterium]
MRTLILYEYPPPPAGLATQGDLLYRGLREIGEDCKPVHLTTDLQKEWMYRWYRPDVAVGVGWWGQIPSLVLHPRKFGIEAVPWLVADGWVANYQDVLNSLPLLLTTSRWVLDTYVRDGVSPKNMVSFPIGCDVDSFRPLPRSNEKVRAVRESLGVADDEKLILTIGGDGASKGSREMMRALAKVNRRFKKWKYVCKVWFQERTEKQNRLDMKLAEQLGIRDKVLYVDGVLSREFMPYVYNACDIYAGPSRQEGFGMPHVEAQACGRPVLSVDAMGIKETVVHGETGFLADIAHVVALKEGIVDRNMGFQERATIKFDEPKVIAVRANVEQLAEYVERLLCDDALARTMGTAAREHAFRNFDYRALARRLADLIRERIPIVESQPGHGGGNGVNGKNGKNRNGARTAQGRAAGSGVGAGQKGT